MLAIVTRSAYNCKQMADVTNTVETPPGYPSDLEASLTLADGRVVAVRPILPSDYDQLVEAIHTADQETLLLRFFTTAPNLTEARIHHLAEVDYETRLALVAFDDDERGIAVARYEGRPGAETAEVAVTVDPEWRRVGLATSLLERLEPAAIARGITRFEALYLPQNRVIADIFENLGYSPQTIEEGIARVEKKLV